MARNLVESYDPEPPIPTFDGEVDEPIRDNQCAAEYDGWTCTRTKGHGGRHVAFGFEQDAYAAWEDDAH